MAGSLEKDWPNPTGNALSLASDGEAHDGSRSAYPLVTVPQAKPVNNTWWRRNLTLLAIKITRRLPKRRGCNPLPLPGGKFIVKYGDVRDLSEAHAIRFIAQHTSMPVPKIYSSFEHKGRVYIVMEFMKGRPLIYGWDSRSDESKAKILKQLKVMVDQMRSIPHPQHLGIANSCGGSLFDCRLPGPMRFGPFTATADFHRHIREGWDEVQCTRLPKESASEVKDLITKHEGCWPIHFTHGDLNPRNIMVSGDQVTGIIDWETAGWYPSYWEYTNTWHVHPWEIFWQEEVDKFLEPMPNELAMEQLRRKYFDDF
ncbi:MAG: hypothetical protein Q9166_005397 [cf. Caloplaca sp. 2 TL-2023]